MSASLLDVDGPAAPPRANGELVFAEPWQSRIFGVTMALYQGGCFEWSAFQAELIAAIERWESSATEPYSYYTCWLQAFESLMGRLDLLAPEEMRSRVAELVDRPAGHDHDHGHGHGHGPDHG
ncbi:MAG: nitrile hydratase accessory protein [Actinomycetota bacterium]|nr:nitrile hydratase accessory protein [Actinomycetota bacterium]